MTEYALAASLVDAALRGAAIALLSLVVLRLWRDGLLSRATGRLLAGFALALCVQIASSTPLFERALPPAWQALPVGISVGNSVLFWLFVQLLFDDDFVPRWWHAALWSMMFVSGVTYCLTLRIGVPADAVNTAARIAIRWLPLGFAALALLAAIRRWSVDLLESRRRLRAFVVIAGAVYTVAMVAFRVQSGHGMLAASAALLDIFFLLVIVAVATASVMRLRPGELFASPQPRMALAPVISTAAITDQPPTVSPAPPPLPSSAVDAQDHALLDRLSALMTGQRVYAQENLTISTLARQLNVPEYRLRRAINVSLGHRNFNAYVNEFRLREACAALRDPAKRDLPVLTIALTAGFQSIGPFNRAFKALTGLTPTEFRQQNSADS